MRTESNYFKIKFKSISENEAFARAVVAAFCLQLNPSVDQLSDIKTVVSEAVTNCVVHAYPNRIGDIVISCEIFPEGDLKIQVSDKGVGIKDIEKARQPFFTTGVAEERSGMGFTIMETFMDKMTVENNPDRGTTVTLIKHIEQDNEQVG